MEAEHKPNRRGARQAQMEARRALVARGLLAGLPVRQMARELEVGVATVVRDKGVIYERWQLEQTHMLQLLKVRQLQRLEALMANPWQMAVAGDHASIQVVLSLMKREAEIAGLDAPLKTAQTQSDGTDVPPRAIFVGGSEAAFIGALKQVLPEGNEA